MQASSILLDYLCPSDDQARMIYQGMKHWEDNTCIRFKPRTNQQTYVNFFPGSNGWATIGYMFPGSESSLQQTKSKQGGGLRMRQIVFDVH